MEQTKTRNISFDILKILSMLFVVVIHATGSDTGFANVSMPSFDIKYFLPYAVRALSLVAVNCFVMITGYFMSTAKEISYKKLIRLWITVVTYSLGIYIALCIVPFSSTQFSAKELINNALPVISRRYWFITCYFILYLLAPFLNKLIDTLDQKSYKTLLLIMFIVFVCVPTVYYFSDTVDMHSGYTFCWFVVLYLFAAYIRRFSIKERPFGWLYLAFSAAVAISMIVFDVLPSESDIFIKGYNQNPHYNSILVFAASICLFLFFKNNNISSDGKLSKPITKISSLTLAVYLIHENQYTSPIIWNKIVKLSDYQDNQILFCGRLLISILAIFVVCIIIEFIRSKLYDFCSDMINKRKG